MPPVINKINKVIFIDSECHWPTCGKSNIRIGVFTGYRDRFESTVFGDFADFRTQCFGKINVSLSRQGNAHGMIK